MIEHKSSNRRGMTSNSYHGPSVGYLTYHCYTGKENLHHGLSIKKYLCIVFNVQMTWIKYWAHHTKKIFNIKILNSYLYSEASVRKFNYLIYQLPAVIKMETVQALKRETYTCINAEDIICIEQQNLPESLTNLICALIHSDWRKHIRKPI